MMGTAFLPTDAALSVTHASLDALLAPRSRLRPCGACRGLGLVYDDPPGIHGPPGDCGDCDGSGLGGGEPEDAQDLPRSNRMLCPGTVAAGRQTLGWGRTMCPWCGRGVCVTSWHIAPHVGVGVMCQEAA